ncbi:MAG: hypothetical protein H6R18_1987 [Proteobacteria bacterium]|nr:hypothetical protein [Pseudomonadota bacterium]
MKRLTVMIHAELEVPDDWEVVEHPSGMQVLKIGAQYVDFDLAPLATTSTDPEAEWSDAHSAVINEVLDTVSGLEVDLKINTHH